MKSERFVKEYLENFKIHKVEWNYEDGCVLMGCVQLYEITKDEEYKEFVLFTHINFS